eukprot:TRINITY_DN37767_c0_g1_i1.p1 TRINITY_DN37767_c0_g1~~TRINITY_DN37767_c0_g1_i1.p1  ORF type:complete len:449 (+),score=55.36 TRINITY_DN37767_c0_g1_i1:62-1408(+)
MAFKRPAGQVAASLPAAKKPRAGRKVESDVSTAVRQSMSSISRGHTLTKMEVVRLAMQKVGQGDEAISTGIRTVFAGALKRLVQDLAPGWHRVVSADGSFWSERQATSARQLAMLRSEGARPEAKETIAVWANRVGSRYIGSYKPIAGLRAYVDTRDHASEAALKKMDATRVEALDMKSLAKRMRLSGEKHFHRLGEARPGAPTFHEPLGSSAEKSTSRSTKKILEERIGSSFGAKQAEILRNSGAVQLKAVLSSADVSELMRFAAKAKFAEVVQLLGEGGSRGCYCFCQDTSTPSVLYELRRILYDQLLHHFPELQERYGASLDDLQARCRKAGQKRSANIFLSYGEGGINLAHQDPYGALFFPYQAMLMLSKRGRDFRGGEFFVKDPATKAAVDVAADTGDVTLFAANEKALGPGGNFKHGVREVKVGTASHCERFSVGLVFNLRK